MMNTYLDVGALRVQAYLTRSYRLRGRARGSGHIAELSQRYRYGADHAVLRELLGDGAPAGWEFTPDAGEVDGVVSLQRSGQPPDGEVAEVAGRVLRHLRGCWPGAQLHAVCGSGEFYVDAYRNELGPKLSRHEVLFSPPPADEFPLARPCELCEQDAATDRLWVVEQERELCSDCVARGVQESQAVDGGRAVLLEELATLGDSTHLGTVFVDGNAVGALFAGLAGVHQRAGLSRALAAATRSALDAATAAVQQETDPPAERQRLVHVSGGDDLLVSLPASRAWRFGRQVVSAFGQEMAAALAALLDARGADPGELAERLSRTTSGAVTSLPSAAAGVVIAHYLTPMAVCVAVAQERLDAAKRHGAGEPAIAWTDLTVDGPTPPRWRRPWLLPELDDADTSLSRVADLPQSARHAAARLIEPDRAAVSWCRLAAHLDRFEPDDPARAALEPLHAAVRSADDPAPGMDRLLDAITLARWW